MRVKCLETYSVDLRTPARFIIPSCTKNSLRIVINLKGIKSAAGIQRLRVVDDPGAGTKRYSVKRNNSQCFSRQLVYEQYLQLPRFRSALILFHLPNGC